MPMFPLQKPAKVSSLANTQNDPSGIVHKSPCLLKGEGEYDNIGTCALRGYTKTEDKGVGGVETSAKKDYGICERSLKYVP